MQQGIQFLLRIQICFVQGDDHRPALRQQHAERLQLAQCGDVRFAVAHCCDFDAIVVDFDDLLRSRLRRNRQYIVGVCQPRRFFPDRLQQGIQFLLRIQICFVQGDDHRPALRQQHAERLQFTVSDVTVQYEDDEIRAIRDLFGHVFSHFATGFVQTWRVD